jgi:hypothetical protein
MKTSFFMAIKVVLSQIAVNLLHNRALIFALLCIITLFLTGEIVRAAQEIGCPPVKVHPLDPEASNDVPITKGYCHQEDSSGPILLVTHPHREFDQEGHAIEPINKLTDFFERRNYNQYIFFAPVYKNSIGIKIPDSGFLYRSRNGPHDIKFTNAKHFVIAGGTLGQCLCETIRDTVFNSDPEQRLQFDIVQEAVLEWELTPKGNWNTEDRVSQTEFGPPDAKGSRKVIKSRELIARPISQVLSNRSDQEFFELVKQALVEPRDLVGYGPSYQSNGPHLCHQQTHPGRVLNLKDISISIVRSGRPIGAQIGNGPRMIVFNFTETNLIVNEPAPTRIGAEQSEEIVR